MGTHRQFLVGPVCNEVLLFSAVKVVAVESKKAKPNGVFVPNTYQMPYPQAHWEYQSSEDIEHEQDGFWN